MPTIRMGNVPAVLYEAIRARARQNRTSISAEALSVLAGNVPTPTEIARRKVLLEQARRLRETRPVANGTFPSAGEMLRVDRGR